MELGPRFTDALEYATKLHAGQTRKGKEVPYIGHLLGVTSLVLEAGGNEDQAIAALLHDAAEDQGGERRIGEIRERFGEPVARMVEQASDSVVERLEVAKARIGQSARLASSTVSRRCAPMRAGRACR